MREVGSLWIGGPLSWLEYLCISSFVAKGQPFTLFTYGDIGPVPEGVIQRDGREILDTDNFIKYTRKDSFALFADLFRMHMVAQNPGIIWVDTDTYCHAPITMQDEYVFGVENESGSIANGVFGAPADSELLQTILAFMEDRFPLPPYLRKSRLDEYRAAKKAGTPVNISEMPWGTWGPMCLTWFANQTGMAAKAQEMDVFYPVPYGKRRVFLRDHKHLDRFITPNSTAINVFASNKSIMVKQHDGLPPAGSFFDYALKLHDIDPEKTPITFKGRKRVSA